MAAIRSIDNRTECAIRKRLHSMGLRYRKYDKQLPGSPDLVFKSARVAVFIDGDYWHARVLIEEGDAGLRRSVGERLTANYWIDKFRRRVKRDHEVTQSLSGSGWTVLRFWESDARRDVDSCAQAIAKAVSAPGHSRSGRAHKCQRRG